LQREAVKRGSGSSEKVLWVLLFLFPALARAEATRVGSPDPSSWEVPSYEVEELDPPNMRRVKSSPDSKLFASPGGRPAALEETSDISEIVVAFPGAEGFGAVSVGGRGGRVIEVTNLDDSGPGSLRAAIEATGPRTVVFRVGGTIELSTGLDIENPYITIAGQTAPGDGIQIRNHPGNTDPAVKVETHEVVIRYLRLRPGPSLRRTSSLDPLTITRDASNVIVDHCSLSWGTDEGFQTWYSVHDITVQWSIISEALHCSTHEEGCHSTGMLIGDQSNRISIHHNLLAHNDFRNPRVRGGDMDLVNNVIYNAGAVAAKLDDKKNQAGMRCNFVGNYFKWGPDTSASHEVKLRSEGVGTSCFVAGNIGPHRPDNSFPEENIVDPDDRELITDARFPFPPVTTTSASGAYDQVLAGAGASLPRRDAVDRRIVEEVRTGTGRIIDHPRDVGGWPELRSGTAPVDRDHDGMADSWEKLHGLDSTDPSDRNGDGDSDGYTNLEEYLESLLGRSPPMAGDRPGLDGGGRGGGDSGRTGSSPEPLGSGEDSRTLVI
jgi:pectate lyase